MHRKLNNSRVRFTNLKTAWRAWHRYAGQLFVGRGPTKQEAYDDMLKERKAYLAWYRKMFRNRKRTPLAA